MKNVHTPERVEGETFEEYRRRRAASKTIARAVTPMFSVQQVAYGTDAKRQAQRTMNRTIGKRQAKKLIRHAKDSR